jgi:ubiquinone/menaquinone biosynthesis C-methylase UbiE
MVRGVLEKCDFSGSERVVDVAGGFGHMVVALLEKYPEVEGVLLDIPELIPVARQKNPVSDPGVAARLEYVGADMFDGVPTGDVYILKYIVHDWDDERCIQILKNCHQSMKGQGRLICVDSVLPPMGDASGTSAKLLDLSMMLLIRGKERTRGQWEQLYDAAGFQVTNIIPLYDNFGTSIVEGVKR